MFRLWRCFMVVPDGSFHKKPHIIILAAVNAVSTAVLRVNIISKFVVVVMIINCWDSLLLPMLALTVLDVNIGRA